MKESHPELVFDDKDLREASSPSTLGLKTFLTLLPHPPSVVKPLRPGKNGEKDEDPKVMLKVLGKPLAKRDYDHINILTGTDCERDHFPEIARWIQRHSFTSSTTPK
jgi:hypothetical protein